MSLPDVNQLVLAILSGAGSRHVTLPIKKGTKTCVSSREQRYKPLRMGLPRAGSCWLSKPHRGGAREVARARAARREQAAPGADREQPRYVRRGRPHRARRAARDAHRAASSGRVPATEGPSQDARA
jgi:hypothetical protein